MIAKSKQKSEWKEDLLAGRLSGKRLVVGWSVEAAGMCSVGGAGRAALDCSVLEEDWQSGQSYMAHWHSLSLIPQHQHRATAMEEERSAEHGEARRLLQRFLSWAISRNHPHPKTHSARRPHQPPSNPSAKGPKVQRGPVYTQKEVRCVTMRPKNAVFETSERKLPSFLG